MSQISDDITRYLSILNETFHNNEEVDSESISGDKSYLLESLNLKNELYHEWGEFIAELKADSKAARVRDFTEGGGRHSFNCLYTYQNVAGESGGMIISVSVPFKTYGLFFYKFQEVSSDETTTLESYFPLDEEMQNNQERIVTICKKHFPDFRYFDPVHSDFNISKVMIDERVYKNVNLWKVIFTTNLFML